jgi:hypothetical protein
MEQSPAYLGQKKLPVSRLLDGAQALADLLLSGRRSRGFTSTSGESLL